MIYRLNRLTLKVMTNKEKKPTDKTYNKKIFLKDNIP